MHLVLDGAIQKFSLFLSLVQMVTGLEAPFLAPEPRQLSWTNHFCEIKGGKANFSFRDFEPDFLHQYLLKY